MKLKIRDKDIQFIYYFFCHDDGGFDGGCLL